MAGVSLGARSGKASSAPATTSTSGHRRWYRRVGLLAGCVSAVSGWGLYAFSLLDPRHHWPSLRSSAINPIVDAIAIGIVLLGCALALAVVISARLLWRAGQRAVEASASHDQSVETYQLMATTLLKVLRIWRRQRTLGEELEPGEIDPLRPPSPLRAPAGGMNG